MNGGTDREGMSESSKTIPVAFLLSNPGYRQTYNKQCNLLQIISQGCEKKSAGKSF